MSEFKFACPVCGQHITADSRLSGKRLECPTCFRKIVIPPATGNSKLILSAVQATQPRPASEPGSSARRRHWLPTRASELALMVMLLMLILASVVLWRWQAHKPDWSPRLLHVGRNQPAGGTNDVVRVTYPIPTNIIWTLDLNQAVLPAARAAGSINGQGFRCEHAGLMGGSLSLRQGHNWPPELGVTVNVFAKQSEDLIGKSITVSPERPQPLPRVIIRWKDSAGNEVRHEYHDGYALRLTFGQLTNGHLAGQIFISVPDAAKSFVAGSFEAEIRKPPPPRAKPAAGTNT